MYLIQRRLYVWLMPLTWVRFYVVRREGQFIVRFPGNRNHIKLQSNTLLFNSMAVIFDEGILCRLWFVGWHYDNLIGYQGYHLDKTQHVSSVTLWNAIMWGFEWVYLYTAFIREYIKYNSHNSFSLSRISYIIPNPSLHLNRNIELFFHSDIIFCQFHPGFNVMSLFLQCSFTGVFIYKCNDTHRDLRGMALLDISK